MTLSDFLDKSTIELIALSVISAYIVSWFLKNPMPNEALLIVLSFYFGKKAGGVNG